MHIHIHIPVHTHIITQIMADLLEWLKQRDFVLKMASQEQQTQEGEGENRPQAAVAATPEDLAQLRVVQSFQLNNVALKWFRDSHENPPGKPTTDCVDLTKSDPMQIGVIEKNTGMEYAFKANATQPWSWRQMLAGLSPAAKDLVLGANPTLGVVRITCQPVPGSYDHKRWHAAMHIGRPYAADAEVLVWDFFVTRTDGTTVRFHTNYSNKKVEVASVDVAQPPLQLPGPPQKGKGKSDGPGTYRRKTTGNYEQIVGSSKTDRGGGDRGGGDRCGGDRGGGDRGEGDRGGGCGSGVAEPNGQVIPPAPPGLQQTCWNGWNGWRDRGTANGWHDWHSKWQSHEHGAAGSSTDNNWNYQ